MASDVDTRMRHRATLHVTMATNAAIEHDTENSKVAPPLHYLPRSRLGRSTRVDHPHDPIRLGSFSLGVSYALAVSLSHSISLHILDGVA